MNPFDMLKNVDEIKKQAQKLQEQMKEVEASGSSGGGLVEARANGKMEIISLKIDPTIIDKNEASMMEVLITSAINTALQNVRSIIESKASEQMAGINFPWSQK